MFHTFETTQYVTPDQADTNASAAAKRKTSTTRACEPCRRRKIRCNGEHPCETCQWYRKTASCHYTEPRQRQVPSKRSVEKIAQTLQEYRGVLQKLFPSVHPEQLTSLPRERLLELISKTSPLQAPSPITPGIEEKYSVVSPDAGSLEQLQPMPEGETEGSAAQSNGLNGITDDVNALSLSFKQSSSYLGISSVMAILRVILWLDPESQNFFGKTPDRSAMASRETSSPPDAEFSVNSLPRAESGSSSAWDEIPLINAYFTYVHPFIPLIEEQSFRDTYMTRQRHDGRWQLLLNTVLAMGSVAANTSDDTTHRVYFERANQFLDIDILSSAHLETVQALAILSGFYLHYLQLPNQANALMGATLRIATTLGLHRDYTEGMTPKDMAKASLSIEMRRRVWWSTFILDSWVGNTLGRPSMGRMSRAISAKSPQEPIGQSVPMLVLIQENIRFCIISTRMEDSLAVSPLIEENERRSLDALFVEWFKSSSVQHSTSPRSTYGESPGVTVTKNVMRWRYLLSRIILHRPVLLWYAMRKMPFESLSVDKKTSVKLCREVTAELINDIAATWSAQTPCTMSGWNATWLLYQAVMVPLLSLFSDHLNATVVESSRQQVDIALTTLSDLYQWSTTAKRSLEVVSRIYEASKRHYPDQQTNQQEYYLDTPATENVRPNYVDVSFANTATEEMAMENMFDSLNWSTGLDSLDYPFETPGLSWETQMNTGWSGVAQFDGYFNPVMTEQHTPQISVTMHPQQRQQQQQMHSADQYENLNRGYEYP